jgi:hypothetical protein
VNAKWKAYYKRFSRKSCERTAAFREHGIMVTQGTHLGELTINAGNADKLLRLLRKVKKETTK